MENELVAFGNTEIEESTADNDDVVSGALGHLEIEEVVDDDAGAVDEVEADDDAVQFLDDVEDDLINRIDHVFGDLLHHPRHLDHAAAIARIDALYSDTFAELDASAARLRRARADLEDATRRAAAANAAPVLPGTEQEAARLHARPLAGPWSRRQRDVDDLVEHRRLLVEIVLGLIRRRALTFCRSRFPLVPAVIIAFVAAQHIVAYVS